MTKSEKQGIIGEGNLKGRNFALLCACANGMKILARRQTQCGGKEKDWGEFRGVGFG